MTQLTINVNVNATALKACDGEKWVNGVASIVRIPEGANITDVNEFSESEVTGIYDGQKLVVMKSMVKIEEPKLNLKDTTYDQLNKIAYKNGCMPYDMFEEFEDGDEVRQGATVYQTEDGACFTEM